MREARSNQRAVVEGEVARGMIDALNWDWLEDSCRGDAPTSIDESSAGSQSRLVARLEGHATSPSLGGAFSRKYVCISPLPLMMRSPHDLAPKRSLRRLNVDWETCTRPGSEYAHIRAAVLTASPHKSYWYVLWPITPAMADPESMPTYRKEKEVHFLRSARLQG